MSKEDYLRIHLYPPEDEEKRRDRYDMRSNEFGNSFWKHVLIAPKAVPQCSRCLEDLRSNNVAIQDAIKRKQELTLKTKCCYACLWFLWFHEPLEKQGIRFREMGRKAAAETLYDKR